MSRRELALYIHIPFCQSKCAYCDFVSYPGQENVWESYVDALRKEMREWKDRLFEYEAATIFLGGGTPSLLPSGMIESILDEVRSCVSLSPDAEISMEANPGTLTMDKLKACRKAGFNRLSIGAQSFEDRLLKSLGRIHTSRQIYESVDMARVAGFDNLNLDLMYALPGQEPADWRHTLDSAIMLKPDHVSAYSLIVEPGTPMAGRVARGEAILPDDDQTNGMQRMAVEKLAEAGYVRYEISNFAQPGYACRHNLTYWLRGDYLGLGCAAHSMMAGWRFANPAGLHAYLSGERRIDVQQLSRTDAMEETLMLSTRTCRGLDRAAWYQQFGEDFLTGRERQVRRLQSAGLIELSDDFLRITLRGMEVHNAVVLELMR